MVSLAKTFGVTQPNITHWFDSWERAVGLQNKKGQGPKFILTQTDVPVIKAKVQANPQELIVY